MITTVLYTSGKISFNLPRNAISKTIAQTENTVWTDIKNPDNEDLAMLDEVFHFHPLAIENCLKSSYMPKVANFDEYLFLTFYSVNYDLHHKKLTAVPLHIFIGKNFLVTFHRDEIDSVPETFDMIKQNPAETLGLGADHACYLILDLLTESYLKLLDGVSERIDRSEEKVFMAKTQEVSSDLFGLKKDILHLRRIITPQRDNSAKLTRDDITVISKKVKLYFHDIYDRLFRICETIDTCKDIVLSTQDLQLSIISNKTNKIVKTLTIITTVIMPLSLITGIYGMNFEYLPEKDWRYGYFAVLLVMLAIAVTSLLIFKKKKWF